MNRRLASIIGPLMALPHAASAASTSLQAFSYATRSPWCPSKYRRGVGKPYVGPTHPPTRKCRACGWWGRR